MKLIVYHNLGKSVQSRYWFVTSTGRPDYKKLNVLRRLFPHVIIMAPFATCLPKRPRQFRPVILPSNSPDSPPWAKTHTER
jgi:hypothetical protein